MKRLPARPASGQGLLLGLLKERARYFDKGFTFWYNLPKNAMQYIGPFFEQEYEENVSILPGFPELENGKAPQK